MGYTSYDFIESVRAAKRDGWAIPPITRVLVAWGENTDYDEWTGGFILEHEDGSVGVLTGWCDTTGWGCQDGADYHLLEGARTTNIDIDPIDLNLAIKNGELND